MAGIRVHLDELGVERVEILPEKGELPEDAFLFVGGLGPLLAELDRAVRRQSLARAPVQPKKPPAGQDGIGQMGGVKGGRR